MGGLVWKLLVLALSRPVSSVLRSTAEKVWARSRPGDPPRLPGDPKAKWLDAVIWAVLSGVSLTVGQLVASRGAGEIWRLFGGGKTPLEQKMDKQAAKAEAKARKAAGSGRHASGGGDAPATAAPAKAAR